MNAPMEAVAAFVGISNENEFFSHHYLSEVFKGDIQETLQRWQETEDTDQGEHAQKAPFNALKALSRDWFSAREKISRERSEVPRLAAERALFSKLFNALGYSLQPNRLPLGDVTIPILGAYGRANEPPRLIIIHAWDAAAEDEDLLTQSPQKLLWDGEVMPHSLHGRTWQDVLSDNIFGADHPPRFVLLAGSSQTLLIDRAKWPQNRLIRFEWNEILSRRDDMTLKATAALLASECLIPDEGDVLVDTLDENSHKHAFSVSNDLKYAIREAVELIGNEAAQQLIELAKEQGKGIYSGANMLDEGKLTLECLRTMYRLLFLFYIEARPDLGYVPIRTSDVYQRGYSLEMLRDLEMTPLVNDEARKGTFFDESIRQLFRLIHEGYEGVPQARLDGGIHHSFSIEPLDSHLFDPASTPLLNKVRFPNHIWQRVIQLMSLSKEGFRRRRGRVSYAQLGINQLGAVYEALLSYRGFFAKTDLYEVKRAEQDNPDPLEAAHFVPVTELDQYKDEERVYDKDENGHKKLRLYPKGSFIYRLAGRDREKSASFYTPEVLTKCLVKYALKELLKDKTADEILNLTVCEPAMGSAAFLNEGVNQLAAAYLERKQVELGKRIPHDQYADELQKAKMYIADRNVFGVDLNPVAVQLAEVSLWLNAISGSDRVPWFGYQLFCGNSLVGARRQVFNAAALKRGADPAWHETEPRRLPPKSPDRKPDEIYHFLLPDPGMVNYTDKVAKERYPDAFKKLKEWRKAFCKPLDQDEIAVLQELSSCVDDLWELHAKELAQDRAKTEDWLPVWGQPAPQGEYRTSTQDKDLVRANGIFNEGSTVASAYRRIKMVMDYWCSLWFWPLDQADLLPSRETFLFEIGLVLRGNVVDTRAQSELDLVTNTTPEPLAPIPQGSLPGMEVQLQLSSQPSTRDITDRFGQLHIEKLFDLFPRLKMVDGIAQQHHFFHWELTFADVFQAKEGFDLILGNPPWIALEWSESGVLGEFNPLLAIRPNSASDLAAIREAVFERYPEMDKAWRNELEDIAAQQSFLSAAQNYSLLSGQKTNLYKSFVILCWALNSERGIAGLLHQEGFYEAARAGSVRQAVYRRLHCHFHFINEMRLFSDVHHNTAFSINIYGPEKLKIDFLNISSLFHPKTIDDCFNESTEGKVEGLKDERGNWNINGCIDRIVHITDGRLKLFSSVFDAQSQGIDTRLPTVHSASLITALEKLESFNEKLHEHNGSFDIKQLFDENVYQQRGLIRKDVGFRQAGELTVLSGPNMFIGNPYFKAPYDDYQNSNHYRNISLVDTQEVARKTVFSIAAKDQLLADVPPLTYDQTRRFHETYRVAFREMVGDTSERTLMSCLIAPGDLHINTIVSIAMSSEDALIGFSGMCSSLPVDYLVKSTGTGHIKSWLLRKLPIVGNDHPLFPLLASRVLLLNSISEAYAGLWNRCRLMTSRSDRWMKTDPRLDDQVFSNLAEEWSSSSALRTDYQRRQALVELDVISAQILGLTKSELLAIYRIQFPVLQSYEKDTWFDQQGRVVFTTNRGQPDIGLPRREKRNAPPGKIIGPSGEMIVRTVGWEDVQKLGHGWMAVHSVLDDTQPGGNVVREITYNAPFDICDRELDYDVVWEELVRRKTS